MDRYIYDELANLPLTNALTRIFVGLVAAFVPEPNVAYILDAGPEAARARKPEYPVDFLHRCRSAYLQLARMLGNLTVIPPLPLEEAKREVEAAAACRFIRWLTEQRTLSGYDPTGLSPEFAPVVVTITRRFPLLLIENLLW